MSSADLSRFAATTTRSGLAVFFFIVGCAKFVSGYQRAFGLSVTSYYCVAAIEVMLGIALLIRRPSMAPWAAIVFACFAITIAWFMPGMTCGCLGATVQLSRRSRMMVGAVVGMLGSALVYLERTQTTRIGGPDE